MTMVRDTRRWGMASTAHGEDDILQILGDPAEIDLSLTAFRKSAQVLSSEHPRMIDQYAKQWVAIYDGEVRAQASTFLALMNQAEKNGLRREQLVVRFIDRNRRTMIL